MKTLEVLVCATVISCNTASRKDNDTNPPIDDTSTETGSYATYVDNPPIVESFQATASRIPKNTDVLLEAYITDDTQVILAYTEFNGTINIMEGNNPYTTSYNTTNAVLGENKATLVAYDSTGQTTTTETRFVVYDSVSPTIENITVNPGTLYILDEDPFVIAAKITDDITITAAKVTINSIESALTDADGDSVYEAAFSTEQFAVGTYTFTISASDGENTTEETSELTIFEGSSALVAYTACYDFENNLNDNTGMYNATTAGSLSYRTGVVGYAVDLTGVNAAINTTLDMDPTNGFTIAGWVYFNANACSRSCNVWDTWHGEGTHELALFAGGSDYNEKLRFLIEPRNGGADEQLDSLTETRDLQGAWHHIVTSFSNAEDTQVMYIDGAIDNARTITVDNHDGIKEIWLGQYGSDWFSGLFDTVMIYDKNLSETEIDFLYNSGSGRACF